MLKRILGKSLAYKLSAIMTLVVIITLIILIILYISFEKDFVLTTAEYRFSLINRTFTELISYTNEKDHSIKPTQIIESLGDIPNIDYITIYDANGQAIISSIANNIKKTLTRNELERLSKLSHERYIINWSSKTLDYIAPIRNDISCKQCHTIIQLVL